MGRPRARRQFLLWLAMRFAAGAAEVCGEVLAQACVQGLWAASAAMRAAPRGAGPKESMWHVRVQAIEGLVKNGCGRHQRGQVHQRCMLGCRRAKM